MKTPCAVNACFVCRCHKRWAGRVETKELRAVGKSTSRSPDAGLNDGCLGGNNPALGLIEREYKRVQPAVMATDIILILQLEVDVVPAQAG